MALLSRSLRIRRATVAFSNTSNDKSPFTSSFHDPVMWRECVDALMEDPQPQRPRVIVDGTLGGGGHSQALLHAAIERNESVVVFGCDVDPDALQVASERLVRESEKQKSSLFVPVHSNFCNLSRELLIQHLNSHTEEAATVEDQISNFGVDGFLLDLGVSSHQIDTAERGFSFQQDGPLDMRMNNAKSSGALTAADICNEMDVAELRRILRHYGDEPRAKAIAESIAKHRPLTRTKDLHDAVAAVTPEFVAKRRRMGRTASLARVFQSLRIVVNQEDVVLDKVLSQVSPRILRPGGRLAVLSYHSLEDRATKRIMRDGTLSKKEAAFINNQRDVYGNFVGQPKPFRPLGKPKRASAEEVQSNPRSRSATLRVAERLAAS